MTKTPPRRAARKPRGPGRGRAVAERGKETEARVLDAAELVFAQLGFNGARTQEIAEAAGVTKAMIHYYFDSKERLYRAVLDRILFELIRLVQDVRSEEASRVRRLETFIRGFFDYVARHPHFGRLTFMASGAENRYFDTIVTGFLGPLFARGVAFIEEGIHEGTFRKVDAPQFLLSIYAATMGYFADAHFVSLILEDDAMSKTRLAERRQALLELVSNALGVSMSPP
jgi:TetR/AcrR family transcriptional regulator